MTVKKKKASKKGKGKAGRKPGTKKIFAAKTMLLVADMSFNENLNNHDIAKVLQRDRKITSDSNVTWVQHAIDDAGKWLLNRHKVLEDLERRDTPERQFAREVSAKLGLKEVILVPEAETPSGYVPLSRRYAETAANYFDGLCRYAEENESARQLHVAVCGGQGILDMMNSLVDRLRPNAHFYPAALLSSRGGMGINYIGPDTNATVGWSRCGKLWNRLFYAAVPPYQYDLPGDAVAKHRAAMEIVRDRSHELSEKPHIEEFLTDMNAAVNAAIVGLGMGYQGEHVARGRGDFITGILKPLGIDPKILQKEGAVGDIAYNVIDADGVTRDEWNFALTAGYGSDYWGADFYRNLVEDGNPVIVMAGLDKKSVLKAAIRGKLVNVLITDVASAKELIKP